MPKRQPMVTPRARPPLAASLEEDISSCSTLRGGGVPQPKRASQYSTYHADLENETKYSYHLKTGHPNTKLFSVWYSDNY